MAAGKKGPRPLLPFYHARQQWAPYNGTRFEIPMFNCMPNIFYRIRWIFAADGLSAIPGTTLPIGRILFMLGGMAALIFGCYMTRERTHGSGAVAGYMLVLAYIFSMRTSVFTFLTGVSFERLLFWHKVCATLSVVVSCYHGWVSMRWDRSGTILTAVMALMCLLALYPIRRRAFEFFYRVHWILMIVVLVGVVMHAASIVLIGVAFWFFDLVCRTVVIVRNRRNARHVTCDVLPSDIIRLSWKKNDFKYKSGQYVFICIPELSLFEWHPFSISSSPHQDEVCIHIRALGDWTGQLHKLVTNKKSTRNTELRVYIEGPYGTTSVDVDSAKYTNFLFISGGIGITPMQSICNELIAQHRDGRPLERIDFIWSVRDRFMVSAVTDDNRPYQMKNRDVVSSAHRGGSAPLSFSPNLILPKHASAAKILNAEYYLTQCRSKADFADANIRPSAQPFLKFGRPDLENIFARAAKQAKRGERIAVLACGPSALIQDAAKMCAQYNWSSAGAAFDFHEEIFDF